ncbi:laccase [Microthyrium microscopicum]|uniref:laccase n=1 Tax=Microthyrium microscopicum TaxID=703497 RepID=A0A6A6UR95_9PEZI|nr:laccase [Microthyrium microscopicum]
MHISQLFYSALFVASTALAKRLPADHILWGPGGPPSTLVQRQVATSVAAAPVPSASKTADRGCSNGPLTRSCWGNGFSISTDFDEKWPDTGKVRSYNMEITNTTCAPDGISRTCLLINGQYPGPTIVADWGDTIQVTLKNSMQANGTGFHWHGIRQLGSNSEDGVPGVTECPLAPGQTKTYTFKATQYGTSWYHSHYSVQYGDGVVGTMQINGPATANYDIDLGPYPVTDWMSNKTMFQFLSISNSSLQTGQGPPPGDNILINGTNVNAQGGGKYGQVTLTPGKKHRLRIINTSVEAAIRVSLDGHPFQVITNDFVPIKPFFTSQLLMAIGQRYDVIITANQTTGNFWFRAEPATDCATAVSHSGKSIFTYAGTTLANPTSTGVTFETTCVEPTTLVPWWPSTIPSADFASQVSSMPVDLAIPGVGTNNQNIVAWTVNLTAINIDWEQPTLAYIGNKSTDYPTTYNVLSLPTEGIWTYWIIQQAPDSPVQIPHPLHLHGHDFWILGRGDGVFDTKSNLTSLNFNNPPRRDVTFLPASGWVVITFPTDNPGAWLMHCHIATHISAGLGVQFLEATDKVAAPNSAWSNTCAQWDSYYNNSPIYVKDDSGL